MRTLLVFWACYMTVSVAYSQIYFEREKRDYNWLFGKNSNGTLFNFNNDTLTISDFELPANFNFHFSNAIMSSADGTLLFYSNGIYIYSANQTLFTDGDTLLPIQSGNWDLDSKLNQGLIAVPVPDEQGYYYLLQMDYNVNPGQIENYLAKGLYYSKLFYDAQTNAGTVIEKSIPLLIDTLSRGRLMATRHGNGRDWWFIVQEYGTNRHYKFIADHTGIHEQEPQNFGIVESNDRAQVVFSPDGTKYIKLDQDTGLLRVYNFDRCTGMLSNERLLPNNPESYLGGCAFSADSKFLYAQNGSYLVQYFVDGDSIHAPDTVAIRDSLVGFSYMQLAPNGKIYIAAGTYDFLSVINHPELQGVACDVCQACVDLPNGNNLTMFCGPDYSTGPMDGSPCDTLGIDNPPPVQVVQPATTAPDKVIIYPNPANGFTTVQFPEPVLGATLRLYNVMGQLVLEKPLRALMSIVELDGLAACVYFYEIIAPPSPPIRRGATRQVLQSGKLVKL